MSNRAIIRFEKSGLASQSRVYVISAGKFLKIGVSASPPTRLQNLQTSNPTQLALVYESERLPKNLAFKAERDAHRLFSDYQVAGEWFGGLDAQEVISGLKNCVNRRLGASKHPWSGTESICAVCGEDRSPAQLDDDLTCWVCRQDVVDGVFHGNLLGDDAAEDE